MALSCDSDPPDAYAGLRIAHVGFRRREFERRRVKSADFRSDEQYQTLLAAPATAVPSGLVVPLSAVPAVSPPLELSSPPTQRAAPAVAPRLDAALRAGAASPPTRARGLNLQFGLPPGTAAETPVSPRLEGSEWDAIDERTRLMAQLHSLQAEIVHLARRDNERIGVAAGESPARRAPPGRSSPSRPLSDATETLASTSFSSSDTLVEEDTSWADFAAADPFDDGERHLVMNSADLQKLRDFRGGALRYHERPSVSAAFSQVLCDVAVLARALLCYASFHKYPVMATLVAALAIAACYFFAF